MTEPMWERYSDGIDRIKVDGGFVYRTISQGDVSICFVPEIDLQRYESHLRDAYNKGFTDGSYEALKGLVSNEVGLKEPPAEIAKVKEIPNSQQYYPESGWRS